MMPAGDEAAWTQLDGIDPMSTTYPVSVRFDERSIWIFRAEGGAFFGIQDMCPHTERTLGNATIIGNGTMIRCAFHNYTFKLANGKGVNCPGFHIDVYDVKEEEHRLLVRRRAAATP
jgi:nitrite reductase/ring-hydroxylating ferredoxin subunit